MEGVLTCTGESCLSEYPVIDGIPILVADLRTYISQNIHPILMRHDLSETMESLVGDCLGPGSFFDASRQHLSTYCFDHYGSQNPSVKTLLEKGLDHAPEIQGPIIDMGCSVGRTSFDLAQRFEGPVLGVDLNFSMIQTAASLLNKGVVSYPRRRVGIVYDQKEVKAPFENRSNLDFWVCDATAMPFADSSFSLGVSLNLLDCVGSPYDFLKETARLLNHNKGYGILSTPYDWTPGATPVESWIGGHSQRTDSRGSSEKFLISLLAGGSHPHAIPQLELIWQQERVPWTLRLHDRSKMEYQTHMVVVKKGNETGLS